VKKTWQQLLLGITALLSFPSLSNTQSMLSQIPGLSKTVLKQAHSLNPKVLQLALKAHDCAVQKGIRLKQEILTIIDFSRPSKAKRLWVIDTEHKKILYTLRVAHGKRTGLFNASHFSNRPGSKESSLGLYMTRGTYQGHHGYSLRLKGLEAGFNNNALRRKIVLHGARYVTPHFLHTYGRLGRSWGCPAVNPKYARPLINEIKQGSLVFVYYPQKHWLKESKYLHC